MAAERDTEIEMQAHEHSYSRFVWMMKWGTVVSLITAFIVVLIIRA